MIDPDSCEAALLEAYILELTILIPVIRYATSWLLTKLNKNFKSYVPDFAILKLVTDNCHLDGSLTKLLIILLDPIDTVNVHVLL